MWIGSNILLCEINSATNTHVSLGLTGSSRFESGSLGSEALILGVVGRQT